MSKESPHSIPTPSASISEARGPAAIAPVRIVDAEGPTGVKLSVLRQLWFRSLDRVAANGQVLPGNGFAPAFLKLGRAVYVDVGAFHALWRKAQSHHTEVHETTSHHTPPRGGRRSPQ